MASEAPFPEDIQFALKPFECKKVWKATGLCEKKNDCTFYRKTAKRSATCAPRAFSANEFRDYEDAIKFLVDKRNSGVSLDDALQGVQRRIRIEEEGSRARFEREPTSPRFRQRIEDAFSRESKRRGPGVPPSPASPSTPSSAVVLSDEYDGEYSYYDRDYDSRRLRPRNYYNSYGRR